MTRRNPFPKIVIAKALQRCIDDGLRCECHRIPGREWCGRKIKPGKGHAHHIIPDAEGGPATLDNCAIVDSPDCHNEITRELTMPEIVKSRNQRVKHWMKPEHRPKPRAVIPGSKASRFKKRLDGTVVDRETGEPI